MSGLALLCDRLGARVTGSDRAESSYLDRLRAAGLEARLGHDPEAVPPDAEVVVSTAVSEQNPELARARQLGLRVLHRGELLAEICAERRLIAVAGTHGKTTTSGMLAHVLRELGADPAFVLGGELPGAGAGGRGRQRRLGRRRVDRRRGGRVRRQLPAAGAGGGRDHQRGARPSLPLGVPRRADRGLSPILRAGSRPGAARRREPGRARRRAAGDRLRHRAPRARARVAGTGTSQRPQRPGRPGRARAGWIRARAGGARAGLVSGDVAPPGAEGPPGRSRGLRRLRAPPDRGGSDPRGTSRACPPAPDRRLPATPVLADQGPRLAVRTGARGSRRGRGARRLSRPRGAGRPPGRGQRARRGSRGRRPRGRAPGLVAGGRRAGRAGPGPEAARGRPAGDDRGGRRPRTRGCSGPG